MAISDHSQAVSGPTLPPPPALGQDTLLLPLPPTSGAAHQRFDGVPASFSDPGSDQSDTSSDEGSDSDEDASSADPTNPLEISGLSIAAGVQGLLDESTDSVSVSQSVKDKYHALVTSPSKSPTPSREQKEPAVHVAVRVRPSLTQAQAVTLQHSPHPTVHVNRGGTIDSLSLRFHQVFEQDSTQQEVSEFLVAPAVKRVVNGVNAAVMCYGQVCPHQNRVCFLSTNVMLHVLLTDRIW